VAALVWSGVAGAPALAGDWAYGGGYSVAHDSNLARVPANPVAEQTQVLFGGVAYQENTPELNARLLTQVQARHFSRNTFSDDTGVFLDGAAVWTMSPKRFTWTFEELYRQARLDLTLADTPANRAETSTLSSGPDLTLRLNAANSLGLGARYGRFDIKGPGDNRRASGIARLLHNLSAVSVLSLNYEAAQLDFTPPSLFTKIRRDDLFGRYESRTSPTDSLAFEIGTTRLDPEGAETQNGRRVRLALERRLTPESGLRLSYADVVSDTFTDLLARSATFLPPTVSSDVYRNQSGDFSFATQGARVGYSVQGFGRRIDFENVNQDYDEQGGRLGWTWQLSGDLRFQANTEYLKRTFLNFDRTDTERNHRLGATYLLTRNLSLVAEGEYTENTSSAPLASFVNRRVALHLAYRSGHLYEPQIRE